MEIFKLFYHGDPNAVDNVPLVEVRCYVVHQKLCVVWCDYSYLVKVGLTTVVDVNVTADMELFDVFVASNLITSSFGMLSVTELLLYRSQFAKGHQIHHQTSIELERRIQAACDSPALNARSFLLLCEDLASSIMRAEYYQSALTCCDRKLEATLWNGRPPCLRRPAIEPSSGRRSIPHLPNEILIEIFLRCNAEFPSHKPTSPPISLSQVCSLWRTLAFGIPDLWNRMTLDTAIRGYPGYDVDVVDLYSRLQMIMDTWACRANQHPLHWRLITDGTSQLMPQSFKEAFFSHSPSIQTLDAYFALLSDFDALLRTPVIFPNLSSLKISCMQNDADPFVDLNLISRAPRLTSLALAFRLYTPLHNVHDLHFASITHLDLLRTAMACNLVFDILKRCKNLQEGAFHTYPSEIPNDESDEYGIVQDKLRSLTILANSEYMSLFPKVEYPSLERLHYAPSDTPTWSVDTPVPTFYQFRHIHHLTFADFEVEGNQFLAATFFFTKVETLTLRFRGASEYGLLQKLFRALMDISQETNYLPKLKSLTMQRCKLFPVSDFVGMISRRACKRRSEDVHRVSRLKSVVLHFKHHCNASEALVRLVDCRKIRGISFILEVDNEMYCHPVSETGVL